MCGDREGVVVGCWQERVGTLGDSRGHGGNIARAVLCLSTFQLLSPPPLPAPPSHHTPAPCDTLDPSPLLDALRSSRHVSITRGQARGRPLPPPGAHSPLALPPHHLRLHLQLPRPRNHPHPPIPLHTGRSPLPHPLRRRVAGPLHRRHLRLPTPPIPHPSLPPPLPLPPPHLRPRPLYARYLAHSLFSSQHFFLQLDSHIRLTPGWDVALIAQLYAAEASLSHPGPVYLTGYRPTILTPSRSHLPFLPPPPT